MDLQTQLEKLNMYLNRQVSYGIVSGTNIIREIGMLTKNVIKGDMILSYVRVEKGSINFCLNGNILIDNETNKAILDEIKEENKEDSNDKS